MYELRQQQRKELREKKWFPFAILAIGVFVFSQACSLMPASPGYSAAAAILGIILHRHSVDKVFEIIFKKDSNKNAKIVMIILLFLIAVFSYFRILGFPLSLLLDFVSIILFAILSQIFSKFNNKQE